MAEVPGQPHPDRSRGVFETLLVLDGRPVDLDAHLARLRASLEVLYPDREPPALDVPGLRRPYGGVAPDTPGAGPGAMRVTVGPVADSGLRAEVSVRAVERELVFDPPPVALGSFTLRGGLGEHKWADRSLLDTAQAELGYDQLPVIVDEDGAVLEAARANLFAVREQVLATPPLDGRILPGITRARVLEIAAALGIETQERELGIDDLRTADEILLTGSVRGVERVRALDGAPPASGGGVGARIAAELRSAAQPGGSLKKSLLTR